MNLIIELIIRIFQALFEKDAQQRNPPPGPGQHRRRPQGRDGEPVNLEEWMESLFGQPQSPQDTPAVAEALRANRPPRSVHQPEETLAAHLLHEQERLQLQKDRLLERERQLEQKMGHQDGHYAIDEQLWTFHLPGRNPLEQAIYADVILGPCKASKRRRTL